MNFDSEQSLVDRFVNLLETDQTPWGKVCIAREFDYKRGRTDVVAVLDSTTLIAIEAKLENWKAALHQAYRNTCFAHQSFVLLPKHMALTAACFIIEFEKRGVGLCYIDGASLVVLHHPPSASPLEPWLAEEAISQALRSTDTDTQCPPPRSVWSQ